MPCSAEFSMSKLFFLVALPRGYSGWAHFWKFKTLNFNILWLYLKKFISMLLFHEVYHWSKTCLLIDGAVLASKTYPFKNIFILENGILKEVGSNESNVFAC